MYSTGIKGSNALIIDIGYENTLIVPIIEFMTRNDFLLAFSFAGKSIENHIFKLLIKNGIEESVIENNKEQFFPYLMKEYFYFDSESEEDYEREAIEKRKKNPQEFFVFQDKKGKKTKLTLPDPILPESLIVENSSSLDQSLSEMINTQLLKNLEHFGSETFGSEFKYHHDRWWVARIIITGGASNILGLRSLIIKELLKTTELKKFKDQNRLPSNPKVDVDFRGNYFTIHNLPFEHTPHSWIGGSIEWSLKPFFEFFITKEEYQNNPEIVFSIDYESPYL